MDPRTAETRLARFTLGGLAIYAPLETWASLQTPRGVAGLLGPFYLVDLIGMVLMLLGAVHSLRRRPRPAPGLLCAAYAWTGANFWRATFGRVDAVANGEALQFGAPELCVVGGATAIVLACLVLSLVLTYRAASPRHD